MRSKNIFGIITFFATFAFSAFIALLFAAPKLYEVPPVVTTYEFKSSNHKRCRTSERIKEFLVQDKRNGFEMHRLGFIEEDGTFSRSSFSVFADSVNEYANESGSMDESGFPRDFQLAWREHMNAWSDYAEFLQESKDKKMSLQDFITEKRIYNDAISSTWYETLRVGREYGADLPAGF